MTSTRKLRPRGRPPVAQSDSDSARTLRRKNANASGSSSEEEEEEEEGATATKRRAMPMRAAKSSPIKKRRRTTVWTSSSSSSEDDNDDDDDDDERPSEADKIRSARSAGKSPPSSPRRKSAREQARLNVGRLIPAMNRYNNPDRWDSEYSRDGWVVHDGEGEESEEDSSTSGSSHVSSASSSAAEDEQQEEAEPPRRQPSRRAKQQQVTELDSSSNDDDDVRPQPRSKRAAIVSSSSEEEQEQRASRRAKGKEPMVVIDEEALRKQQWTEKILSQRPPNKAQMDPVLCRCGRSGLPEDQYHGLWVRCSIEVCHKWQHARCFGWRHAEQVPKKHVCHRCRADVAAPLPEPEGKYAAANEITQAILDGETLKGVQQLTKRLKDVDWDTPHLHHEGFTPLIAAVVKGRADIVQFLFLQGASIWPDDMANRTALHHAAALGDAQVFDLLLDYGASSDPPKGVDSFKAAVVSYYLDKDGHTILDCTLQNKSLDPFLSLVNDVDGLFPEAIHVHDTELLAMAIENDNHDALSFLTSHGVVMPRRFIESQRPIHLAVAKGARRCLDLLLEMPSAGEQLDSVDSKGRTLLHLAAETGDAALVEKILLRRPELVNIRNAKGQTPLHRAVRLGHVDCAHTLLAVGGAGVSFFDKFLWPPILYVDPHNSGMVWQLLSHDPSQLTMIVECMAAAENMGSHARHTQLLGSLNHSAVVHNYYSRGRVIRAEDFLSNADMAPGGSLGMYDTDGENDDDDDDVDRTVDRQMRMRRIREKRAQYVLVNILHLLATEEAYFDLINDLLRKQPQLLKTTLAFLGHQPGLLNLENKRVWLLQEILLHRSLLQYNPNIKLRFPVVRGHELRDTIRLLASHHASNLFRHDLSVTFEGEVASGAGVTREFFEAVTRQIMSPAAGLLEPTSDGRAMIFSPDAASAQKVLEMEGFVNESDRALLKFARQNEHPVRENLTAYICGILVGVALRESYVMPSLRLSPFVFRLICRPYDRSPLTVNDLEMVDAELAKNLRWILDNPIAASTPASQPAGSPGKKRRLVRRVQSADEDEQPDRGIFAEFDDAEAVSPLGLTFSVSTIDGTVPLRANGERIPVLEANKKEYVDAMVQHHLWRPIRTKALDFVLGVEQVIPSNILSACQPQELSILLMGSPDIDVDDWRLHSEYSGYSASSPNAVWFWTFVASLPHADQLLLLAFCTGSSAVPVGGFANLQGLNGPQRFRLVAVPLDAATPLPSASTCFNMLKLPMYTSEEQQRRNLLIAIRFGSVGFSMS